MKKLFPNIETLIIFVFVICVMLWGVTRCNRKKDDLAAKTALENSANAPIDSLGLASPAARNAAKPVTPTSTTVNNPSAPPPLPVDPNAAANPQPTVPAPTVQSPATVQNPTTAPPPPATTTVTTTTASQTSGTLLYVLIDGLNVRTKPDLKAKSLGKLKLNDQVYFLNEVTPEAQTVRLIDKTEVTKPWFKIKTKKGTVGWVHGSGVDFYKRKPHAG